MIFGLYFAPTAHGVGGLLNWGFGGGIGTNIGASIIWGFLAGLLGLFVARQIRRAWTALHAKLDAHRTETTRLHAKIDRLHGRHDAHAKALKNLAERLEELHAKVPERRKRAGS